jgi:hypothetical protein
MKKIMLKCIKDENYLTVGRSYLIITFSGLNHWKLPVVGVINDDGNLTVYDYSSFEPYFDEDSNVN